MTIHAMVTAGIMTTNSRFRATNTRIPRLRGKSSTFDHWGGVGTMGLPWAEMGKDAAPLSMMARQVLRRSALQDPAL
ncbi:hypothetical protein ACFVZW_33395 [Streptomyces sp. NPDC059567]|uniref:hypothetical protein n=1 Tax=Streptomyces sp. NPDC059567 TaxID=3346867 RepID=UPI0036761C14